ncbi:MAG: hypothetical protein IJ588_07515 [Prevotella sp.]|nr:hypothetical protein [Prevotella sp.]
MRKFFRMYLTLALMMLGVTNVSAEEISLQEVPFWTHSDKWGLDEAKATAATPDWNVGVSTGQPYGDGGVKNFADLSTYSKLIVVATEGTPRIMMNRDVDEGLFDATEANSHLIEYPKCEGTWAEKYFTKTAGENEGETVYTVDLKQMVKDKGFAYLHAIKGANWQNTTVTSMVVVKDAKVQQVGWTNLINNSNMEGDDASSFFTKVNIGDNAGSVVNSEIVDGQGKDGSRGVVVKTGDKTANDYDNQFWFRFNEAVPAGTKYKVSFDYRADEAASVGTQAHAEPSDYIHWKLFGNLDFTTDWQTFELEDEVSADQSKADKQFQSAAFNLNPDNHTAANTYYFDNIKFEIYKYGTTAEFSNDVVLVDFGFDTNVADLVKKGGKPRLLFPNDCATVKVNGKAVDLYSIEGFADGRFYVFLEAAAEEKDEVTVSFNNPADEAFHIVYTSGAVKDQDVKNFSDVVATLNAEVEENEGYPYDYLTPVVLKAEPEDGSFNLPNSIKEFKLTFDKDVDCAALTATINGAALAVAPNTGFATDITLTREGGDLTTGEYTISVNKIYPKMHLGDEVFGDTTYTFSVGKVELDPNDVEETVMTDDFAASGNSWITNSDAGGMQDANSGSGCRLMHGQAGFAADILYLGQRGTAGGGVALYGTKDDAKLTLKAKNYHLMLKAAKWDGDGAARTLKVQVLPEAAVNVADGSITDETQILVEERKAIEPDFKTTTKSTDFDIIIPVTVEGNYIIRLVPGDSSGEPAGYNDASAIGNVKVQYLPYQPGAEWIRLLDATLESAKAARNKYAGERYEGADFTALDAAIAKYEVEKEGYTNPSAYATAAEDLTALANALENHGGLCDSYDEQIKQAIDVIRQVSAETDNGAPNLKHKFMATELFGQLETLVAKYHGSSAWRNVADTIADPTAEEWKLFYNYDSLKVDADLTAAIAELKDIVANTSALFTAGVSATGDSGVKVLVDRLRRGAEALKSLGVAEDDELVQAAVNALTDDDELAEKVKLRIKENVYGQLKEAGNELFKPTVDADLNEIAPKYDMSVFFKNPNIYALQVKNGVSAENVPGWNMSIGTGDITTMWVGGTPRNIPGIAEDVAFTKYHSAARFEQTVSDLPAGVYTVVLDAASWADDDVTNGFVFVKTSETPAVEDGAEEDRAVNFAATVDVTYYGQYQGHHDQVMENIVVTDGVMTVGMNTPATSQWMFDQIKAIYLTAPATGFDYASAYAQVQQDIADGIDLNVAQPAKVRAIEIYNLDGRRINSARQGIVIVKKYMSDGTVKTEKVVKK